MCRQSKDGISKVRKGLAELGRFAEGGERI